MFRLNKFLLERLNGYGYYPLRFLDWKWTEMKRFLNLYYAEEGLFYRPKYWFQLNISKYIFGFSVVVWRWFFFTLLSHTSYQDLDARIKISFHRPWSSSSFSASGFLLLHMIFDLLFFKLVIAAKSAGDSKEASFPPTSPHFNIGSRSL